MDEFVNDDSDEDLPLKKKKRRKGGSISGSEPEEGEDGEKKSRKKKRCVTLKSFSRTSAHRVRDADSDDLRFRSNKGARDDSDDEEGSSQPKKQRKPKERKKVTKVLPIFFSPLFTIFLFRFMLLRSCCHCSVSAGATSTVSQREDQVQGHHLVL